MSNNRDLKTHLRVSIVNGHYKDTDKSYCGRVLNLSAYGNVYTPHTEIIDESNCNVCLKAYNKTLTIK